MVNKILSIYIPTYNRCEILNRILHILNNYFSQEDIYNGQVEIVVSDNFSNDRTQDVVKSYLNKDLAGVSFKYHCNSHNIGAIENFIQAPKLCSGKYIWLLGDDDIVITSYIKSIYFELFKNTNDIVFLCTNNDVNFAGIDFFDLNRYQMFERFPIASIGHISRLIFRKDFFSEQEQMFKSRLRYSIWTMVIPFTNIGNDKRITVCNLPVIYATKDGGMDIWRYKIALARLAEFIIYCESVSETKENFINILNINFDNRGKIVKDYLAASITNPEAKDAFSSIEILLEQKRLKSNIIIIFSKFLQTTIGRPIANTLRFIIIKK